ncbi:MAG: hypothetical protein LUC92_09595 [Clostridiales bacterium]|nr:hypothetical protein [Clostridiales bacterium]
MNYFEKNSAVVLKERDSFDIEMILECGQCFRFKKTGEKEYRIIAEGKILNIKQTDDEVIFYPCTVKEFETIWINYFDLSTDYSAIKKALSTDPVLKEACKFGWGIRILRQEPTECLISFIISQNNRIPMIKKVIENICEKWGEDLGGEYAFPDVSAMQDANQEELMACKTGFRHKYIRDCLDKLLDGSLDLEGLKEADTKTIKTELMKVKGVGEKVADCVLFFAFSRCEVFPTDVWIKRVMEHFYFEGKETPIKEIHAFAENKWGSLAGYAQQYLFYYARTRKIGV